MPFRRLLAVFTAHLVASCASGQEISQNKSPKVAVAPSVVPTTAEVPVPIEIPDDAHPAVRAGMLLEQAMNQFRVGAFEEAQSSFSEAIATGRLNDAGRLLSYWHIFMAHRQLGSMHGAAEALDAFLIIATDLLDEEDIDRDARASNDFVERFAVKAKVEQARAVLSATWAQRQSTFGQSETRPVPVHSHGELRQFMYLMAPCALEGVSSIRYEYTAKKPTGIEKVRLTCPDGGKSIQYYFDFVTPQVSASGIEDVSEPKSEL